MGFFSNLGKGIDEGFSAIEENAKIYQRIKKNTKHRGVITIDDSEIYFYLYQKTVAMGHLTPMIFRLDELESYSVIENGEELLTGGLSLTRAVAGSLIAGPAGMILGGITGKKKSKKLVNSLAFKFYTKDNSCHVVNLIKKPIDVKSVQYAQLKHSLSITTEYLESVLDKSRPGNQEAPSGVLSKADELTKYSKLKDDGVITQEEFDKLKSELLK